MGAWTARGLFDTDACPTSFEEQRDLNRWIQDVEVDTPPGQDAGLFDGVFTSQVPNGGRSHHVLTGPALEATHAEAFGQSGHVPITLRGYQRDGRSCFVATWNAP